MPLGDGSNPKWGRTRYTVRRIMNLFELRFRRLGYGDLRSEYMRLGSCGSQGRVQSEMMHVMCAQERMSVFMAGSHWVGILLWSVFLRFANVWVSSRLGHEVKFRLLRDLLVQRIDCYLYSRRRNNWSTSESVCVILHGFWLVEDEVLDCRQE